MTLKIILISFLDLPPLPSKIKIQRQQASSHSQNAIPTPGKVVYKPMKTPIKPKKASKDVPPSIDFDNFGKFSKNRLIS